MPFPNQNIPIHHESFLTTWDRFVGAPRATELHTINTSHLAGKIARQSAHYNSLQTNIVFSDGHLYSEFKIIDLGIRHKNRQKYRLCSLAGPWQHDMNGVPLWGNQAAMILNLYTLNAIKLSALAFFRSILHPVCLNTFSDRAERWIDLAGLEDSWDLEMILISFWRMLQIDHYLTTRVGNQPLFPGDHRQARPQQQVLLPHQYREARHRPTTLTPSQVSSHNLELNGWTEAIAR